MRGLKVRIFESPLLARFWEELGAKPVVIPWPKLRRAWLKGEVDLLPTQKAHLYPLGFCRRGRFVTLIGDVPPQLMVAVNEARYNCLPPGVQTALVEACDAAGDFFSREVDPRRGGKRAGQHAPLRRHVFEGGYQTLADGIPEDHRKTDDGMAGGPEDVGGHSHSDDRLMTDSQMRQVNLAING